MSVFKGLSSQHRVCFRRPGSFGWSICSADLQEGSFYRPSPPAFYRTILWSWSSRRTNRWAFQIVL